MEMEHVLCILKLNYGWSMGTKNFIHVILNNASHDPVGGQPTNASIVDIPLIAKACGYKSSASVSMLMKLKIL